MLKYIEGDLFSSPAQVLVNAVNTVGVMGKGLALEFRKRYPKMFEYYKVQHAQNNIAIGKLLLWYGVDHWLLQFPTKEHWRNPSKLEYIEQGLIKFAQKYADYNISSIAFPKLGCGNGGLHWHEVKALMEKYLKHLPIEIYIYTGNDKSAPKRYEKSERRSQGLQEEAKDFSFTGVKNEICFRSAIVPVSFVADGKDCNAYWSKEGALFFAYDGLKMAMEEEKAHQIWDGIFDKKIFVAGSEMENRLFYCLLETMGYLREVNIQNDSSLLMVHGYQLDMGKGRLFLLQGA